MLVLTRKLNEKVRIGDSITVTVLRMKGKAVRLGIEAPHDVNVLRGELVFELPENGEDSSQTTTLYCELTQRQTLNQRTAWRFLIDRYFHLDEARGPGTKAETIDAVGGDVVEIIVAAGSKAHYHFKIGVDNSRWDVLNTSSVHG